jgi:DNA-binding protein WhiA
MSFSSAVKNELLDIFPKKACCKQSEAYGMILCGRHFSKNRIAHTTDSEGIISRYRSLVKKAFDSSCDIKLSEHGNYHIDVEKSKVSDIFVKVYGNTSINTLLFSCDNCFASFLRGAFLVCGFIGDPNKEYRVEFSLRNEETSWEFCKLLKEHGFPAKTTERRGQYIVYFKESSAIEDFLTMIGATTSTLNMMNIQIEKEFRNQINRKTNFETANMQKTAKATAKYLSAIEKLESCNMLSSLPPELYEAAVARRENFEMSLSELGSVLGLTRSGIYHRLEKIVEIANEIK